MKQLRRALVAPLVAAGLQAAPASAVVYVVPTDASLVDRSPIIVFGEVQSAQPGHDGRLPSTDYLFTVEEVLKGFLAGSAILVRQPGGVGLDGTAMSVMGLPMLRKGDRVLLFLRPEESSAHQIVEYALGMFWEVETGERSLLLREPSLQAAMPIRGDASRVAEAAHSNQPRDADRFRHWIADRAAGVERAADYFDAEPREGPAAVRSPYRLLRTRNDCLHDLLPLRWQDFDLGRSVRMTVQSGGQVGVPGGGAAELGAAMGAWNGVTESHVELATAGPATPTESNSQVGSGQYWILFEDPFDSIEGSYDPETGGTLAVTLNYYRCGGQDPVHQTLGEPPVDALQIVHTQLITQDGYGDRWAALKDNPRKAHEEIMAHELGHVLGIGHSCGGSLYPCPEGGAVAEAIMRANARGDGRGARLSDDDLAALRYLYPMSADASDPGGVACSGATCLLQGERFRVKARYSEDGSPSQSAGAVEAALGNSAGLFRSDSDSPELLVRIVNKCSTSGYWEVYAGAASNKDFLIAIRDTETNELKWFRVRNGRSAADTQAFPCSDSDAAGSPDGTGGDPGGTACGDATCVLQDGFFRVKSWYRDNNGSSQGAQAIPADLGPSAGLFTFDGGGPELLVRIEDTCGKTGYWAVYAGAASDAAFSVAIRDTEANELRWFRSRDGTIVADAEAFSCSTRSADLVISSTSVSDDSLYDGGAFTLNATVKNQGDGRSRSTTLRYYVSADSTISASDSEIGTETVRALPVSATRAGSIALTAPSTPGTYYYGACVDPVFGESATDNNCSVAARVAVQGGAREYRYDDGTMERFGWLVTSRGPVYEQEFAQRFQLSSAGRASHVILCVGRDQSRGTSSELPFTLNFYRDSSGVPGTRVTQVSARFTISTPGTGGCARLDLPSRSSLRFASGYTWVGLAWRNSTGLTMGIDQDGQGGGTPRVRARVTSGSQWTGWQEHPDSATVRAFGIRLGVDHGGGAAPVTSPILVEKQDQNFSIRLLSPR